MPTFAVSVIGPDRPGIVSDVTRVLLDHELNVEDAQATVLRGHFTLTLLVSGDDRVSELEVLGDLEGLREDLGLESAVIRQVESLPGEDPEAEATHVVTVFGLDRPGLVHAISAALAESGVSVRDLNSRVIPPDGDDPAAAGELVYGMMLEVAAPGPGAAGQIARSLDSLAAAAELEISVRPLEPEEAG